MPKNFKGSSESKVTISLRVAGSAEQADNAVKQIKHYANSLPGVITN